MTAIDPQPDCETIHCALCGRDDYPRSRAISLEDGLFLCGRPRLCSQYAQTQVARSIVAKHHKRRWRKSKVAYAMRESPTHDPFPYPDVSAF